MRVLFLSFAFFWLLQLLMMAGLCEEAHAMPLGVRSPTAQAPVVLGEGRSFSVDVAIPIALTPPPGVQKSGVWKDWHVYLSKAGHIALGAASAGLRYEVRLLHIGPCTQNVQYVVEVEAMDWMPAGRYDLEFAGPGFSYSSPQSVVVTADDAAPLRVVSHGENRWQVETAAGASKKSTVLDVVIGAHTAGVEVWMDGRRLIPSWVGWASSRMVVGPADRNGSGFETDGRRLLRFERLALPETSTVVLKPLPVKKNTVSISLSERSIRPMQWVTLHSTASFTPVQWIWQFVDGDTRTGAVVKYRWMVGTKANASVTGFDVTGAGYSASLTQPLRMPLQREAPSCAFVPAASPRKNGLFDLFKTCIETILLLME